MLTGVFELNGRQIGQEITLSQGYSASSYHGAIGWDGRLDNGSELRQQYGCPYDNDAETVLSAFERGAEPALRRLIGDWSLVFWDAARSTVWLASDYTGVRPLYYHHCSERVMWSSSLAQLASSIPDAGAIDEDYAAEFLERGGSSSRTPYRGIRVVPPGHALCFSQKGMEAIRFWEPSLECVSFHDERDYAARLHYLFEEAVAVRLRNAGTVYTELSGGLDSSAVVCMAHRLIREGRVNAGRLATIHYRQQGSPDGRFQQALEKTLELDSICVDTGDYPFLTEDAAGESTPMWWESRDHYVAGLLGRERSNVLLTGRLGDLVMGNHFDDSEQVADLLGECSIGKAFSAALAWSGLLHVPVYSVIARALRANFSSGVPESPQTERSLTPEFRERARVAPPGDSAPMWKDLPPSRRKHFHMLQHALASRVLQTSEPLQPNFYTHPYTHRPLVEYMLAIPPSVVCGPGQPRKLMRRAFAGLLPPAVLARRSKASFQTVFRAALYPLASALLEAPQAIRVVSRGWVELQSLVSRIERFRHGLACNEGQLRQIILLEFWLRSLESRRASRLGHARESRSLTA